MNASLSSSIVTWCSNAVNFSFFRCLVASRTRSSPGDTLPRLCVRRVRGWSVFPSVPALCSTHSAAGCPALFAGFFARMAESDFSSPFIIGFDSSSSRCGPSADTAADGQAGDLPVPAQGVCAHARVFDHAGSSGRLRWRARICCLPPIGQRRHPGHQFCRGSMAGLCVPLSTLRAAPRDAPRMTRGQHDSLRLCREGLAPFAPCRFVPAHPT